MDFQEKKILYKVRKTILEMIEDRGYYIPESEKITFEQFGIKYNNKNIDIYINDEFKNKKMYVYFHNELKSFSKSDLKKITNDIFQKYNDDSISIILLLKDKENSAITKELSKDAYKNIEVFIQNKMIFNITHHIFVPKHIIITQEEENEVLEKYNTKKGKLPKISKTDPIAKYYGMKTNQVCKIIRNSPEVGEYIYYRLVR
jgi:DNA-directed RNA polymerase I, II, and III subunit RPABC1